MPAINQSFLLLIPSPFAFDSSILCKFGLSGCAHLLARAPDQLHSTINRRRGKKHGHTHTHIRAIDSRHAIASRLSHVHQCIWCDAHILYDSWCSHFRYTRFIVNTLFDVSHRLLQLVNQIVFESCGRSGSAVLGPPHVGWPVTKASETKPPYGRSDCKMYNESSLRRP